MKEIRYILLFLLFPFLLIACNDETEPGIPGEARPTMNPQDSLAMVAFYHSMKCAEWKGGFHWDLTDYTTWGGVKAALDTAKNEYRITEIEVPDAATYLPDGYSLPKELGWLPCLRSLIIWGDGRMAGGIPEVLADCPLELLYIAGQDFTRASLPDTFQPDTFLRYLVVDETHPSQSNPDLFSDWEHLEILRLNSPQSENLRCAAPWHKLGTASALPQTFLHDVTKEDGWSMAFHTFMGQMHFPNYLCLYNQASATVKVFYYHVEKTSHCDGKKWLPMTFSHDGNLRLLYDAQVGNALLMFSNPLLSEGMNPGWHGFLFQIPQPASTEPATQIRLESPSDNSNRVS